MLLSQSACWYPQKRPASPYPQSHMGPAMASHGTMWGLARSFGIAPDVVMHHRDGEIQILLPYSSFPTSGALNTCTGVEIGNVIPRDSPLPAHVAWHAGTHPPPCRPASPPQTKLACVASAGLGPLCWDGETGAVSGIGNDSRSRPALAWGRREGGTGLLAICRMGGEGGVLAGMSSRHPGWTVSVTVARCAAVSEKHARRESGQVAW